MGPVQEAMRAKLTAAFTPTRLIIEDQSDRHAGHAGAVRADGTRGETHFHVTIASAAFRGLSRLARQRAVHAALAEELAGPVHALSLRLDDA